MLEIRGCRALVRGDTQAGDSPSRRNALLMIRNAFEAIHATIPKIEVLEKMPLPDQPNVVVDYDYLLTLEDHEEDRFIPLGTQTYYLVEPLLNSIVEPDKRKAERDQLREVLALKKSADAVQGNPFMFPVMLMAIAVIVIMLTQIVFE